MPNRATTLALILTSVALALPAAADERRDGGRWMKSQGERHAAHRGGMERMRTLFKTYDTNADGALTQQEIDTARTAKFSEFDGNGDGQLSLDEYQALWADAMRAAMVDRFQAHDENGDGQVTSEEFAAQLSDLVARLDRNGDGALSREDMRRSGSRRSE